MGSTRTAACESFGSVHVVRFNPRPVVVSRFFQPFGTSIVKIEPASRTGAALVDPVLARVPALDPAADRSLEEPPPPLSAITATITATTTAPMTPGSTYPRRCVGGGGPAGGSGRTGAVAV